VKYVFGPVLSRRLGISLGLDLIPFKTCTLDCIYCECGRTTKKTTERKPYIKASHILDEVKQVLVKAEKLDYITLGGSGEPTLNSEIGTLINEIKKISDIPVAVLTNGTLLHLKEVRKDLQHADLVIPSLDAVSPEVFKKIDRPAKGLDPGTIIDGLIQFRKEYKGKIWLEVFFVKGVNDSDEAVDGLIKTIRTIRPDKVQLNTIDRPPAEPTAMSEDIEGLRLIYERFRDNDIHAEIIKPFEIKDAPALADQKDVKRSVISLIKRRPETIRHISLFLGLQVPFVNKILRELEQEKKIKRIILKGETFYKA